MAFRSPAGKTMGGRGLGGRFSSTSKLPPDVIRSIEKTAPAILKVEYGKIIPQQFENIKKQMIAEFLSHPVTKEIMGGPSASNISSTLGGVSNLFAFIGFDSDEDPLKPILDILNNLSIRETSVTKGMVVNYEVNLPTAEEIFDITPMPWASGRSWAKGIESGISGLGYLIKSSNATSRSGVAIQSRNKIRGGKYTPVPYISSFISKYKKQFSQLI
jgi:hypothetical protein